MKDANFLVANGVDVKKSLELFGDMETYNATLEDFLSAIEEKLKNIRTYKEASDMANYAILVHSLKSDSKYFGFMKLADISYQHELKSKENDSDWVFNNFEPLMAEANRVHRLVKIYLGKEKADDIIPERPFYVRDKAIIVVDDSNIVRSFVEKIFNNEYQVLLANDGDEALKIINNNPHSKLVAMLLDLNMPNVNGFEVLDYLKTNNLFKEVPVSIITGEDSKEIIEKAFKYEIVDMLTKPFNERDIKRIVEKTINYGK